MCVCARVCMYAGMYIRMCSLLTVIIIRLANLLNPVLENYNGMYMHQCNTQALIVNMLMYMAVQCP